MRRNIAPLLFGIAFILAGIGYLGTAVLGWDIRINFAGWWTLFIIVPSFVSILANGPRGFTVGALAVGILLLLRYQGVLTQGQANVSIGSAIVIVIGIWCIVRYVRGPRPVEYYHPPQGDYNTNYEGYQNPPPGPNGTAGGPNYAGQAPSGGYEYRQEQHHHDYHGHFYTDSQNFPNYNAILSGVDVRNASSDLQGVRVSAILGGADIDLRDAVVTHDITVYVTAVMGGVDIYAPRNVRINLSKTDILGGTDCTAYTLPPDSGAPVVTFCCNSILGGIDIK